MSFPVPFSDFDRFASWALPTEADRQRLRNMSKMADLQAFYDAVSPRFAELMQYLSSISIENREAVENMPDGVRDLCYLAMAFTEVATAVEFYQQAGVVDGFSPARLVRMNNDPLEPKEEPD
jgi:hypothetical protein